MILSLIGMSNAGKTYWSQRLHEEQGFEHRCCDETVMRCLGLSDMTAFTDWLGMPYAVGYADRQSLLLREEVRAVHACLTPPMTQQTVIDTTGSVMYLPSSIHDKLRCTTTIVYLEIGEEKIEEMVEGFFREPKPLIWGDAFNRQAGETCEHALRRCYPALLRWREERYRALADVTIPYELSHDRTFDLYAFLLDQQT